MNFTFDEILQSLQTPQAMALNGVLFSLLLAFIIGQFNAWFYKWTHRGISYSRTFTQGLVLITIISSMSIMLIVTAPLAAFGLLGGLSVIRFRTVVRDARDNVYVLLCLVCGMAVGLGFAGVAIVGTLGANLIAWYLHVTGFGSWRSLESVLRFQIGAEHLDESTLHSLLRRFCRKHTLISIDEGPSNDPQTSCVYQCVYKLRLKNPDSAADLVTTLRENYLVQFVNLLVNPEEEEVA